MHTNRRGINWISEKTYFWLLNIDTCKNKPMNVIPCYSCAFTWLYFTIKVYDRHLSIECHPVHRAMFGLIMRCWPSFLLSCPTELDYIHMLFAGQMKSSELTTKWRNQTKYTKLFKSWLVIHNLNVVLLEGNGGSRIFTNYTVLQFKRFATKTQKRTANKQSEYRQEIAWNRKEIYGIP